MPSCACLSLCWHALHPGLGPVLSTVLWMCLKVWRFEYIADSDYLAAAFIMHPLHGDPGLGTLPRLILNHTSTKISLSFLESGFLMPKKACICGVKAELGLGRKCASVRVTVMVGVQGHGE